VNIGIYPVLIYRPFRKVIKDKSKTHNESAVALVADYSSDDYYVWYGLCYQTAVLISRSSGLVGLRIKQVWALSTAQALLAIFFIVQGYYMFMDSFVATLALIFIEGLLGGSAYLNAFSELRDFAPLPYREYMMGFAAIADTLGISMAGVTFLFMLLV